MPSLLALLALLCALQFGACDSFQIDTSCLSMQVDEAHDLMVYQNNRSQLVVTSLKNQSALYSVTGIFSELYNMYLNLELKQLYVIGYVTPDEPPTE